MKYIYQNNINSIDINEQGSVLSYDDFKLMLEKESGIQNYELELPDGSFCVIAINASTGVLHYSVGHRNSLYKTHRADKKAVSIFNSGVIPAKDIPYLRNMKTPGDKALNLKIDVPFRADKVLVLQVRLPWAHDYKGGEVVETEDLGQNVGDILKKTGCELDTMGDAKIEILDYHCEEVILKYYKKEYKMRHISYTWRIVAAPENEGCIAIKVLIKDDLHGGYASFPTVLSPGAHKDFNQAFMFNSRGSKGDYFSVDINVLSYYNMTGNPNEQILDQEKIEMMCLKEALEDPMNNTNELQSSISEEELHYIYNRIEVYNSLGQLVKVYNDMSYSMVEQDMHNNSTAIGLYIACGISNSSIKNGANIPYKFVKY